MQKQSQPETANELELAKAQSLGDNTECSSPKHKNLAAGHGGTLGCRDKEVSVEIKDSKGYTKRTCSS